MSGRRRKSSLLSLSSRGPWNGAGAPIIATPPTPPPSSAAAGPKSSARDRLRVAIQAVKVTRAFRRASTLRRERCNSTDLSTFDEIMFLGERAFELMDVRKCGVVTIDDAIKMYARLGDGREEAERQFREILSEADAKGNSDGSLSREEWTNWLTGVRDGLATPSEIFDVAEELRMIRGDLRRASLIGSLAHLNLRSPSMMDGIAEGDEEETTEEDRIEEARRVAAQICDLVNGKLKQVAGDAYAALTNDVWIDFIEDLGLACDSVEGVTKLVASLEAMVNANSEEERAAMTAAKEAEASARDAWLDELREAAVKRQQEQADLANSQKEWDVRVAEMQAAFEQLDEDEIALRERKAAAAKKAAEEDAAAAADEAARAEAVAAWKKERAAEIAREGAERTRASAASEAEDAEWRRRFAAEQLAAQARRAEARATADAEEREHAAKAVAAKQRRAEAEAQWRAELNSLADAQAKQVMAKKSEHMQHEQVLANISAATAGVQQALDKKNAAHAAAVAKYDALAAQLAALREKAASTKAEMAAAAAAQSAEYDAAAQEQNALDEEWAQRIEAAEAQRALEEREEAERQAEWERRIAAAEEQRAEEAAAEEEEQRKWALEMSRRKERRNIDREVEARLGDSCPDITVSLVNREIVIGKMMHFKRNLADPASQAQWASIIGQVARAINVVEEVAASQGVEPIHLKVEGHADVSRDPTKRDSPKIMQLTEDRAGAVVRALVSRGSSIELLHPIGHGGTRPLSATHPLKKAHAKAVARGDADHTPDMRVEIHVMEIEERVKVPAPAPARKPARHARRASVAATLPQRPRKASQLIKSRWLQPQTPRHGIAMGALKE